MKTLRAYALLLVALGAVTVLWAVWLEPASLKTRTTEISLTAWPQACDQYSIAVLSDLHVGSPFNGLDKLERVIDATIAAKPDLVLMPGDFVITGVLGGSFVPPEEVARRLTRLHKHVPVYAVLGNHDWWLDGPRVIAALKDNNIPVLEDTATELQHGQCRFWLAGISDYWQAPHDIPASLAPVPPQLPVIAFTHNPDLFPLVPERVTLTIAGHTHGGQVYIPGIGRPITGSKFGERYAIGHVVESGKNLFVSSGLGTSILPVRFLVPPEISVVTITSQPTQAAGTIATEPKNPDPG